LSIEIKGQKELQKYLKKMSNPSKLFDNDIKKVMRQSLRRLKINTNKKSGHTARAWKPLKLSASLYMIYNDIKTADKKHLIVNILNKGRRAIRPKRKKFLYIPLSEAGRGKKLGAKIPKDFEFGVDYILTKRAAKFKGTKFLDKEEKKAIKELNKAIMKRLNKI